MINKLSRRLLATLIDYSLVLLFAFTMFCIVVAANLQLSDPGPVLGQVVGFFSLTLPVYLYFYLTEKSKRHATIGKRIMGLQVVSNSPNKFFLRNLLKLLPWEIAHAGVHWVIHFSNHGIEPPLWIWALLILPQLMVAIYAISAAVYQGESSLYDKLADTKVLSVN